VLDWVDVGEDGRFARDGIDQIAHHARVGLLLGAAIGIVAFVEGWPGVNNDQAEIAADAGGLALKCHGHF